jgi:hypothetical protein
MFVGDEIRVPVSAEVAAGRLTVLLGRGSLDAASQAAWSQGVARVGPLGPVPGLSKLVRVQFTQPAFRGAITVFPLRWEATGIGGALYPALDADIVIMPDGDDGALLCLDGVYRPPGGQPGAALDNAILHRVAAATIRALLEQLGEAITRPPYRVPPLPASRRQPGAAVEPC